MKIYSILLIFLLFLSGPAAAQGVLHASFDSTSDAFPSAVLMGDVINADSRLGVVSMSCHPEGNLLLLQLCNNASQARPESYFYILNVQNKTYAEIVRNLTGEEKYSLGRPDWSPDGSFIWFRTDKALLRDALCRPDGTHLRSIESSAETSFVDFLKDPPAKACRLSLFSPDGKKLTYCDFKNNVSLTTRVVTESDGTFISEFEDIFSMFWVDNDTLVFQYDNGTILLSDSTGREIKNLPHQEHYQLVSISPDRQKILLRHPDSPGAETIDFRLVPLSSPETYIPFSISTPLSGEAGSVTFK